MSVSVGIIIFVFKEYNSRNQAGLDDSCSKRRDISLKDLGILIVVGDNIVRSECFNSVLNLLLTDFHF